MVLNRTFQKRFHIPPKMVLLWLQAKQPLFDTISNNSLVVCVWRAGSHWCSGDWALCCLNSVFHKMGTQELPPYWTSSLPNLLLKYRSTNPSLLEKKGYIYNLKGFFGCPHRKTLWRTHTPQGVWQCGNIRQSEENHKVTSVYVPAVAPWRFWKQNSTGWWGHWFSAQW